MSEPGTAFIVGYSREVADSFMRARGCARRPWGWQEPGKPRRYVFLSAAENMRKVCAPLVYTLPGWRERPDRREIENMLAERGARVVIYPS